MSGQNNSEYVLELRGISKSFPGVKALDKVDLRLRPGSVHALCGENGAGKSTLMKIINGIYTMDEGEIWYKGEKITPQSPKAMLEMGVATIHQELSPILDMTIGENIFLGREPMNGMKMIDWKRLWDDTQKLLDEFKLSYDPKAVMRSLTVSDIALIEIVKAISRDASVVIMDEPTSSITDSEVHILFENVQRLKEKGVGIIYISHKMDEIFEICDEVTIFRDGQWIHSCPIEQIDKNGIIKTMVGREITDQFPKTTAPVGETVLELSGFTGDRFQNINFSLRAGEIVGFAGLVGAGRSELFRAVFGLDRKQSGQMKLEGKTVSFHNAQQAIDAGVLMASEDRKSEGVVLCRSIRENITLSSLKNIETGGFLSLKKEKENVEAMVKKLSIKIASPESPVSSLSGGNQQKVVLAKWLLRSPKVLILDEPTRGIDVGAKYEIYKLMCELAEQGVAIIMISSEMPEILGMSDRVAVMSQGRLTGEMNRRDATQENIMELAVKGFGQ
ncbi:sugar ABC transporter ATP-binding protein [Butyricicoccus sp. Marseille-Q5471]|uniref:sugar ABC transporter ATP-binding protein n=1 Tax=Butyricicoccus sp. Marseille-Q5471 TaxID=3039493 RepID=UPI0024BC79B8|nr:sugar ABC transporter ATP-binding protein [Butyricicoccus sp. Marseille-Q5471]